MKTFRQALIKKIILINLIFGSFLFSSNASLAVDDIEIQLGSDYLIATDKNVTTTFVTDPSIIILEPFFTIFNEKNVLLLHPQKVGKTQFTIFVGNDDNIFNVRVISKKTPPDNIVIRKGAFEIMLLDEPPTLEQFEGK